MHIGDTLPLMVTLATATKRAPSRTLNSEMNGPRVYVEDTLAAWLAELRGTNPPACRPSTRIDLSGTTIVVA
jgi:hypothetical protein